VWVNSIRRCRLGLPRYDPALPLLHAVQGAEVLIPGAGWRGFDATLQLICDQTYVAMTMGRDYLDAAPQRGSFKGEDGGQPPQVHLQIMRQQ
jgi:hypothetical protein